VKRDWLLAALLACAAATLLHHVHNAQFLADYPNLPASLSPAVVYLAWLGATLVGFAGYFLVRRGWPRIGSGALVAYAVYGFDGLTHYLYAPLSAHTPAMNATILLEAAMAVPLLIAVAHRMVAR